MAIMRISRFRDSPETVLAFKHLSHFAEMQPVRDPVATLDAMDIGLPMASHRHEAIRQIVPPVSSAISSEPSLATANAAGHPHTSARSLPDTQNPVTKFS